MNTPNFNWVRHISLTNKYSSIQIAHAIELKKRKKKMLDFFFFFEINVGFFHVLNNNIITEHVVCKYELNNIYQLSLLTNFNPLFCELT